MEALEYHTQDKSKWGPGPWEGEADKLQFTDPETDLPCLIVRNQLGALCGYVGVLETHPWYRKKYSDCTLPTAKPKNWRRVKREGRRLWVWMKESQRKYKISEPSDRKFDWRKGLSAHQLGKLVCGDDWCRHTPEALTEVHGGITFSGACQSGENEAEGICHVGEPSGVWWFGFDTAHSMDFVPSMDRRLRDHFGTQKEYRDVAYVKAEIAALAKQLIRVSLATRMRAANDEEMNWARAEAKRLGLEVT